MLSLFTLAAICALITLFVVKIGVSDGWLKLRRSGKKYGAPNRSTRSVNTKLPSQSPFETIFAVVLLLPQMDHSVDEDGYWAHQSLLDAFFKDLSQLNTVRLGRKTSDTLELTLAVKDQASAAEAIEAMLKDVTQAMQVSHPNSALRVSAGVCRVVKESSFGRCFEDAKQAALNAEGRKDRIIFEDSEKLHEQRQQRSKMIADLDQAITQGDIKVVYMPKRDVRSGGIACAEALARWDHKEWGTIRPDKFIELAEETGQIVGLTLEIMRQVLADQKRFEAKGLTLRVDVNLSAGLVNNQPFCEDLMTLIKGEESKLGFEITETAIIQGHDEAIAALDAFVDAGIWLSIDDYGSGLSSLSYLRQIPAHELKIDRLFIQNLTSTNRDPVLVRSTIDLAHSLGMQVTAEGVEDDLTYSLLRVMKCDFIQGYYVSPPLDISNFEIFMKNAVSQSAPQPALRKSQAN